MLGGWLQQGGVSLVSALFGDDGATRPKTHVTPMEEAHCNTWLLRQNVTSVARELKTELRGTSGRFNEGEREKVIDRVRRATGSDLPTGSSVEVTVQNPTGKAIVLTRLEVSVKNRTEPPARSLVNVGSGCGGDLPVRQLSVDLDASEPRFIPQENDGLGNRTPDFPYKISANDPEVFMLSGYSSKLIEWTATFHWVADGKEGKTVIDNEGHPFLSYSNTSAHYWFDTYYDTLNLAPTS
ncbi:hypothetical protein [Streptomyces sp. NPDC050388]|uniref:hypothetical protein n=1 Tax=Streptomyces sp. NPDC050388 TaxID=3155781 RepID=UPI003415FD31